MSLYLIDFENVHDSGISGVTYLTENDEVCIFYSIKSEHMSFETHVNIMKTPARVKYIKLRRSAKNYLDFQLVTHLGYVIGANLPGPYYIISKDTGYDSVVDYWKDHGITVTRQPSIGYNRSQPKATGQTPPPHTPPAIVTVQEKSHVVETPSQLLPAAQSNTQLDIPAVTALQTLPQDITADVTPDTTQDAASMEHAEQSAKSRSSRSRSRRGGKSRNGDAEKKQDSEVRSSVSNSAADGAKVMTSFKEVSIEVPVVEIAIPKAEPVAAYTASVVKEMSKDPAISAEPEKADSRNAAIAAEDPIKKAENEQSVIAAVKEDTVTSGTEIADASLDSVNVETETEAEAPKSQKSKSNGKSSRNSSGKAKPKSGTKKATPETEENAAPADTDTTAQETSSKTPKGSRSSSRSSSPTARDRKKDAVETATEAAENAAAGNSFTNTVNEIPAAENTAAGKEVSDSEPKDSAPVSSGENTKKAQSSTPDSLPESYRKRVRAALRGKGIPSAHYSSIYKAIFNSYDKLALNNLMVKAFGSSQGGVVYKLIKDIFTEYHNAEDK